MEFDEIGQRVNLSLLGTMRGDFETITETFKCCQLFLFSRRFRKHGCKNFFAHPYVYIYSRVN